MGGGGIFGGCLNFKYFFGVPEIPENFLGWRVDAGPEPTSEEKMWVPPWDPDQDLQNVSQQFDTLIVLLK